MQVTTLLLNLAGVAHVVDAAIAGYTRSALISIFLPLTLCTLPLLGSHGKQLQWLLGYVLLDDKVKSKVQLFYYAPES